MLSMATGDAGVPARDTQPCPLAGETPLPPQIECNRVQSITFDCTRFKYATDDTVPSLLERKSIIAVRRRVIKQLVRRADAEPRRAHFQK